MTPTPTTDETPQADFTSLDWGGAGALYVTTGPPLWPRSDGTWGRDMDARYDTEGTTHAVVPSTEETR